MSDARAAVLGAIRQSLGRGPLDAAGQRALDARMPVHLRPQLDGELIEHFIARATVQSMSVQRLARRREIPAAVTAYLTQHNRPLRIVVAQPLRALDWPDTIAVESRAAQRDDAVSVTPCFAAIAETGSVVLLSSPETPTTLNFVPDDHIVVLSTSQIVWHIEDVWQRLRARGTPLPRAVNIVSGPSRTADIEQVVQLGVHGPRRVHLLVVDVDLA